MLKTPTLHSRLASLPAVAVLTAVCLLAAACGADDDDGGVQTPASSATATPTAGPERTPTATASPTPAPATATPPATPATPPNGAHPARAAGEAARREFARWLGPVGNLDATTVVSVEPVTWSNGCLGLNRVGRACTDALVDGYRVMLSLGTGTYEVRTDGDATVVLWAPQTTAMVKFREASTNSVVFETDDGNPLATQPVAGTSLGVKPADLAPGEAVGIGLAPAPQREGWLLVWLDPAAD